jgi:hypothetical protein
LLGELHHTKYLAGKLLSRSYDYEYWHRSDYQLDFDLDLQRKPADYTALEWKLHAIGSVGYGQQCEL